MKSICYVIHIANKDRVSIKTKASRQLHFSRGSQPFVHAPGEAANLKHNSHKLLLRFPRKHDGFEGKCNIYHNLTFLPSDMKGRMMHEYRKTVPRVRAVYMPHRLNTECHTDTRRNVDGK